MPGRTFAFASQPANVVVRNADAGGTIQYDITAGFWAIVTAYTQFGGQLSIDTGSGVVLVMTSNAWTVDDGLGGSIAAGHSTSMTFCLDEMDSIFIAGTGNAFASIVVNEYPKIS